MGAPRYIYTATLRALGVCLEPPQHCTDADDRASSRPAARYNSKQARERRRMNARRGEKLIERDDAALEILLLVRYACVHVY